MPGGNGTGPMGMGPMTGRAAGPCAGYPTAGFMNAGLGYGHGLGGCGRGWRNRFYATGLTGWQRGVRGGRFNYVTPTAPAMNREQEMDSLNAQAQYLEDTLKDIRHRIEELQNQNK